jgi:hypothetical protein
VGIIDLENGRLESWIIRVGIIRRGRCIAISCRCNLWRRIRNERRRVSDRKVGNVPARFVDGDAKRVKGGLWPRRQEKEGVRMRETGIEGVRLLAT